MKKRKFFLAVLFILYAAAMLWLLFGRSNQYVPGEDYVQQLKDNMNLKPFYTINNYIYVVTHHDYGPLFRHCVINLAGNVVLFVPAGILMPAIWKRQRNFFLFLLTCLAAITFIEIGQLVTLLGSCDVDDLILNVTGMVLGFLLYHIFRKKEKK